MAKNRKERKASKLQLKSRMKNLLLFLPNMVALCFRLVADGRVPVAEKALLTAAIVYAVVPLDFLPDMLPFIGQIDDIYLIALILLRLISRTNANVLREHWRGGGDIVQLADSIASIAPILLPKRVNRVLTARVEMAAADKILQAVENKKTPVVCVAEDHDKADSPKMAADHSFSD